ncbi:hypothetical protein BG003_007695 [Podila horticola]|nr:hypothetical protein BG003_007695 [Podila horticola]
MTGFDVGAAFRHLQEEAAPVKVSIKKLYLMFLPGMPTDTHLNILSEIKPAVIRLSIEKTLL